MKQDEIILLTDNVFSRSERKKKKIERRFLFLPQFLPGFPYALFAEATKY